MMEKKIDEKKGLARDSLAALAVRRYGLSSRARQTCRAFSDSGRDNYRDIAWREAVRGLDDFMKERAL